MLNTCRACIFLNQQADRPREEGTIFTYPYDLGWKENIKQVAYILFATITAVCSFFLRALPFLGYDRCDLQREATHRLKRQAKEVVL